MKIKLRKSMEICRELISSLLFPLRCPVCDEILEPEEKGIHSACESKLYPISGAVCMHCGRPFGEEISKEFCFDCIEKGYHLHSYISQAKSLYLYKGAIKPAIYRLKYSNKQEYASFFAKRAVETYGWWMKGIGVEAIIPVPMYKKKQKKRGYNQAEIFAKDLSRCINIPVDTGCVSRVLDTVPQKGLSQIQRKINMENAFQMKANVVQYRCVLIVDDIYTTGNTAEAVAQQLIKQGIHRVYLLTICTGGDV